MTSFTAELTPLQNGADLLVHLATQRASGVLSCGVPTLQLLLRDGRPEGGTDATGQAVHDRLATRLLVHQCAASMSGSAMFAAGPVTTTMTPRLDTLGEVALAVVKQWPFLHVAKLLQARNQVNVTAGSSFAAIVEVVGQLGGVLLAPPMPGTPLHTLMAQSDELTQRSWAALLVLGGLVAAGWQLTLSPIAAEIDPKVAQEADGLLRRGIMLVRRGQGAAAEPVLRQAVQLNSWSAQGWAYWGFALFCAQGTNQLPQARTYVERALELQPELDVAHEFLGRFLLSEGDEKQAEEQLRQAVAQNPENTFAQEQLSALTTQDSASPTHRAKSFIHRLLRR